MNAPSQHERELTTRQLRCLTDDLGQMGWRMDRVVGGDLGQMLLYELKHLAGVIWLSVWPDGGSRVIYDEGEAPVVRDSVEE